MILRFNILLLLTSHERMDGSDSKTGVWLGEMTDPYYEFVDAGFKVTMASPLGGEPPIDPMSKLTEHITASNRRFSEDETAQYQFSNTLKLENMRACAFDGIFISGGHGPLWDLARHPDVGRLLLEFVNEEKAIAAVCHGPAALLPLADLYPGYLWGKQLTAFSNTEERLVLRHNQIPFELESRLKEHGAEVSTARLPFSSHVVLDGQLITGQNPLSAAPAARTLVELLTYPGSL